jgi:FtsP/CotA-like multicopper oxidase with cupredoxin domain
VLSRREMVKLGLVSGASAMLPVGLMASVPSSFWDDPKSPATTPFVMPLPVPPITSRVAGFKPDPRAVKELAGLPDSALKLTQFHTLVAEEHPVVLHPELPATKIWRYRDINTPIGTNVMAGPTYKVRMGAPHVVRMFNNLPADHAGFGVPLLTTHLHGGHVPAFSDGFPEKIEDPDFDPIFARKGHPLHPNHFDYVYPGLDVGFSNGDPRPEERPSTNWYHDHFLDFTGPNVYRGLAGFFLVFDDLDSDNERDPNPAALRLPSGACDIPLVLADRMVAPDGSLVYLPGSFDGFLGDKMLVNGAINPFLEVTRRKYRFRFLGGTNARMFQLFITTADGNDQPFDLIATGGGLMAHPMRDEQTVFVGPATRREIVVDFSKYPEGTELYLEDRIMQDDGRGPDGKFDDLKLTKPGERIMKFIVGARQRDPSRVPDDLRPLPKISQSEIKAAKKREFRFDRSNGSWTINGDPIDIEKPLARPKLNQPEVWSIINKSGGWWHPIHVHSEFSRVLSRDTGVKLEESDGQSKQDTIFLGPNSEVDIFMKFRDFAGPWVFHCHNLEHEDHFMMGRFDVEE